MCLKVTIAQHLQWVANVMLVPKKDGRIRMYVHLRDLNKATLKDDFPLPHIDILVDTIGHGLLSFFRWLC